jgi:hypothetical protein
MSIYSPQIPRADGSVQGRAPHLRAQNLYLFVRAFHPHPLAAQGAISLFHSIHTHGLTLSWMWEHLRIEEIPSQPSAYLLQMEKLRWSGKI